MQVGLKAAYDCVRAFSETDFTDGLRAVKVPMLIAWAKKPVNLVEKATLKVYPAHRTESPGRTSKPLTRTYSTSSAAEPRPPTIVVVPNGASWDPADSALLGLPRP